jgi:hypothetical protein
MDVPPTLDPDRAAEDRQYLRNNAVARNPRQAERLGVAERGNSPRPRPDDYRRLSVVHGLSPGKEAEHCRQGPCQDCSVLRARKPWPLERTPRRRRPRGQRALYHDAGSLCP